MNKYALIKARCSINKHTDKWYVCEILENGDFSDIFCKERVLKKDGNRIKEIHEFSSLEELKNACENSQKSGLKNLSKRIDLEV